MYWSLPKAYGSWSWRTIREWWFWWICRWLKNNMFLSFSCRSPCYWNSIWPFIDSCQSPTSSLFFFTHHCESLCSLSLSLSHLFCNWRSKGLLQHLLPFPLFFCVRARVCVFQLILSSWNKTKGHPTFFFSGFSALQIQTQWPVGCGPLMQCFLGKGN